jgi:putative nucleotidyltransferase with HDIG domain
MSDFKQKISVTWRDIAIRLAIVLATVAVIVWFMPRDNRVNFSYEINKPWRNPDLTAPFDFPIYKSEATLRAERDSAMKEYEPYYTLNKEVEGEQLRRFMQDYEDGLPGLSADYKSIIYNRLHRLYAQGIVDKVEPVEGRPDSVRIIRIINGKTAVSVELKSLYTTVAAYEQLFQDPMLSHIKELVQQLNLNNYIVPNLCLDVQRNEESRTELLAAVPQASGVAQRGQKIIDRGGIVDEKTALVLESLQKEIERRSKDQSGLRTTIMGQVLYVLLLIGCFTIFLIIFREDYFEKIRSAVMLYSLIILFSILASLLVSHNLLHVFIIPFAMVPIFIRVFMDSRTALMAHLVLVLIVACMLQHPLEFIAVQLVAGVVAIFSLRDLSSRSQLFWTAVLSTLAASLANFSLALINNSDIQRIDVGEFNYLVVCGVLLFCSYPLLYIIEKAFGYTSNITLIELSDMNKELLRRMSEVAPGTFNHSIQVGNLAAEIARKIGGNAQLVRTAALYHDIGKIQNPIYFTENQSGGINPHEHLSCLESAQMIISHVTEGLKLADKSNLPDVIKQFIATHHGQGKAKYFYVKWKNEHPDEDIDDLLFTYPGPNPYTKEQAVLMMADAVEAASRSLPDYTEQSIRTLVNRIIDSQVDDGFFRECPVTFRDIQYAKTVLIEKLKTIYHTRISYPELKKS